MCGLFGGVSNWLSTPEIENIRELGIISMFRGYHSTGLAFADRRPGKKKGNDDRFVFSYTKQVMDSAGFLLDANTQKVIKSLTKPIALIGHCRAATHGAVTKENAHPYLVKHIIGAHNGTIHSLAPKKGEEGTDSLKLFNLIADKGVDEALDQVQNEAYALSYFDSRTQTLNLVRNSQRPLWIVKTDNGETMYWASEKRMLEFMIAGDKTLKYREPQLLEVNTLFSWNLDSAVETSRKLEIKPRTTPFSDTGYRRSYGAPYYGTYRPEWEDTQEEEKGKPTTVLLPPPKERSDLSDCSGLVQGIDVVDDFRCLANDITPADQVYPLKTTYPKRIRGKTNLIHKHLFYEGYDKRLMSLDVALSLLNEGCIMSKKRAGLYDSVFWINKEEYVLEEFKEDGLILEYVNEYGGKPKLGRLVYATLAEMRRSMQ